MAEFERFIKIEIESPSGNQVYRNYDIVRDEGEPALVDMGIDAGDTIPADMGIAESSMSLTEILFSGDLRLGEYNSNKFEVKLFGLSNGKAGQMPDVTGFRITVTDWGTADSDTLKNPIFVGTIDSATTDDRNGYRNIIAYDDMYKYKDLDVGKEWELFWNENEGEHTTHTLKEIREGVCDFVGINVASDERSFPNDSKVFCYKDYQPGEMLAPNASSIKFSDLLSAICELQCICPNINRSGQLEFISLVDDVKYHNYTEVDYNRTETTFEDYTMSKPSGFDVYVTSSTHLLKYPNNDGNSNPYIISGNIFLATVTEDQAKELLDGMMQGVLDITYTPANISMIVSDLSCNLGDMVNIETGDMVNIETTQHCIMSQTLSGPLLVDQVIECRASGPNFSTTAPDKNDSVLQNLTRKEYNTRLEELESRVSTALTQNSVIIEIEKIVNDINESGVSRVTTGKNYTFDDSGLDITDPNSELSTTVTHDGVKVTKNTNNTTMLQASSRGVDATNLHATTYLMIGNKSRLQVYKGTRIGCFMVK